MATDRATRPIWSDSGKPLRILLLGAGDRPHIQEAAQRIRPSLAQFATIVLEDFAWKADLSQVDADLAMVLGGDGSILRAAKLMGENQIPIIGVNLGKLGFLADLSPAAVVDCLPEICRGECRVVEHLMFRCRVLQRDRTISDDLGLNEAAIFAGPPFSIVHVDLYVDGELATTYSCDGLIICTPVGSTAHSLSAGGPILRKDIEAFSIAPISPHTLTVRPIVDSADRIYEMVVSQPNEKTTLVIDGRLIGPLTAEQRVRVERAEPKFQLVEVRGHSYYRTLREKLGWGGAIRRS